MYLKFGTAKKEKQIKGTGKSGFRQMSVKTTCRSSDIWKLLAVCREFIHLNFISNWDQLHRWPVLIFAFHCVATVLVGMLPGGPELQDPVDLTPIMLDIMHVADRVTELQGYYENHHSIGRWSYQVEDLIQLILGCETLT
jgi:hypothetical protein